jgi:lipoprotein-releasing system ATP-binding protein
MSERAAGPWLVAEGLQKGFRTPHRHIEVLRGIDLAVEAGELVVVTGPSGSGKSTLLNLLGSLDRPDEGSILWGGRALQRLADRERSRLRNRELGFVFQFHHLLPDFTALENVMMPALVAGVEVAQRRERAARLLARVGLTGRSEHRPGELSGGEQQRVAVARALVNGPRLLLADEPGGNLDRALADELHALLLELRTDERVSMVVVTHDESLARRADRWLHLEEGRLLPVGEIGRNGGSGR